MLAHLNDDEQLAIKTFAAWHRDPDRQQPWTREVVLKYFDWSESRFHVVMHRLESLGLVSDQSASGIEFLAFSVEPAIYTAADELQVVEKKAAAAQRLDFVESVSNAARHHPVLTWLMVGAVAAAVLLMIINGAFELARNILSLLPPAPLVP